MEAYPAYILAGGLSTRFGSDKARAESQGRPLISTLAEALGGPASRVVVVAERPGKYSDLGLRTIPDAEPGLGPIGGLLTAILDRVEEDGEGWLLLAPCDLVGFDPAVMEPLKSHRSHATAAIAYRSDQWHPLPALYHTSIEGEVRRRMTGKDRSLWGLLEAVGVTAVPLLRGQTAWRQANAPEDL